jgi:uncharacterized protein GlcG (DUF336 family)
MDAAQHDPDKYYRDIKRASLHTVKLLGNKSFVAAIYQMASGGLGSLSVNNTPLMSLWDDGNYGAAGLEYIGMSPEAAASQSHIETIDEEYESYRLSLEVARILQSSMRRQNTVGLNEKEKATTKGMVMDVMPITGGCPIKRERSILHCIRILHKMMAVNVEQQLYDVDVEASAS